MNKFPECVYLGEFSSQEYGNLPAYLPADKGGFCINYQADNATAINRQVENTVLCLLEDTPVNLLQIRIFDFANRPNFPFLNQLKNQGLCQVALNEQATQNAFNELESIIQHRYYNLFNINSGENHLDQYNARSPRPEPYFVLIINTACFPTNSLSAQRLQNFINSAYGAGIYIITLHDPSQFDPYNNNPALDSLLQALPSVQINQNQLKIAEDILPVQKMAQFDFQFTPADINQNQIIKQLQEQLQGDTNSDESDFLRVKIGTQPNGEPAYLSMGKASTNYHAMVLGRTGTGKSTLMNNIIMQIGENYDASQIRLYLMDYKQGVEFNKFQNHPNVEKIFLQSNDIQAGIALLEQLQQDIDKRYGIFKAEGVEGIGEYNEKRPRSPLPYILLMIDEFHKLLQGDYRHNEYVNNLLGDIAKIGRGAGVHLWLSTQSLKDVELKNSIKDQIDLRMTYNVVNEGALGYDVFQSQHTRAILGLQKYEVFIQSQNSSLTAFVDKPLEISNTIECLRLSRPSHLQVQAEIVQSVQNEEKQADEPKQATPSTENKSTVDYDNPLLNPNIKQKMNYTHADKFGNLDDEIAELQKKLAKENDVDDEIDTLDWLKD